jgi:hypothetical protein
MRVMSSLRWVSSAVAAGAAVLGLGAVAGACSSADKASGLGGSCALVTDCENGLVCVPENASEPNGARVCSNSVNAYVPGDTGTPEPDGDGIPTTLPQFDAEPVADAQGGAPQDTTTTTPSEASSPPPSMEASSPPPTEASTPPPTEASAPVEAATPESDASAHD